MQTKNKPTETERKLMKDQNAVQNTMTESSSGRMLLDARRVALSGSGRLRLAVAVIGSLMSLTLRTGAGDGNEHDGEQQRFWKRSEAFSGEVSGVFGDWGALASIGGAVIRSTRTIPPGYKSQLHPI